MKKIRKAVITGATGFIGERLSTALQSMGICVIGIARRKAGEGPWDKYYSVDLGDAQIPDNAFQNADIVFHLAGVAHVPHANEDLFANVNVGGTLKVIDAMKRHGVNSIVYLSSVAVSDALDNDASCQVKARQKLSPYASSKFKAEQIILRETSITHACVLRPPLVYGTGCHGNLERMIYAIRQRRFPPVPSINNCRSMVHVDDLVRAAILAASHDIANRKIYVVTDGREYSTGELYNWIRSALGKPTLSHGIPVWTLSVMAMVGDIFSRYLGVKAPFDSSALQKLTGDACFSSTKIERELGFQPKQNLHSVLPKMVAYLAHK